MDTSILGVISTIGISGIVVVLIFYFWFKKVIGEDIVKPYTTPIKTELDELKKEINNLKSELSKKDDKLEKIEDIITKNTETLNELKTIFNLIKGKIIINFKEEN